MFGGASSWISYTSVGEKEREGPDIWFGIFGGLRAVFFEGHPDLRRILTDYGTSSSPFYLL